MISFRNDSDQWIPREGHSTSVTNCKAGDIIAGFHKAFRITAIEEVNVANWPDAFTSTWEAHSRPDPETWYFRPLRIIGHWEEGDTRSRVKVVSAASGCTRLPEHYSVCRLCREVPPCKHVHTERIVERELAGLAETMAILPGCCHACREPVTHRQKTIRFPGPNLIRPDLADGTAVFHARQACFGAAFEYDEQWAAAEPGRRRLLYCEGRRRNHNDGSMECSEGAECPGDVQHRSEEWHRPEHGSAYTSGCWCVSGDLGARVAAEVDKNGMRRC